MELLKDRCLLEGQKVKVYVNLNKMGKFSIQDQKSGLVVGYADSVLLENVQFRVSKSGQARARREGRRNVHAVALGNFVDADISRPDTLSKVGYYNPFVVDTFVDETTKEPLHKANLLFCHKKRVFH